MCPVRDRTPLCRRERPVKSLVPGSAPDQPFSAAQIEYAGADAEATLRLYLAQQRDMIAAGLYPHLMQVEFPYAEANARMEWDGVPVSRERLTQLLGGLGRAVDLHRAAVKRQSQKIRTVS
jgi:DNA polymerase I-like protein with 3'-5' exonuclease and polymerase domains